MARPKPVSKSGLSKSKRAQKTFPSNLPKAGTCGMVVAPRWRIQASFEAIHNGAVREAMLKLIRAEEK